MVDFFMVSTRKAKNGIREIYPKFIIRSPSKYLMIRGGDFYAVWVEEKGLWSTSEQDALDLIDKALDDYAKENSAKFEDGYKILHMWDAESGMADNWHKYCQRQMRDSFHMLDEKLIFSNTQTSKEDYASKRLSYPLESGDISAWDKLVSVLYSPAERRKIEWAIGSIVAGDSVKLQKFMVFYGAAGTGKSTIISIIEKLFEGYTATFDSKALGQSTNAFALEPFKKNPLVAIEHDGDLSRIEDNTRLNSLVSHERMSVNEKFAKMYENSFKCFLFMGTNRPVKITDAKSGLLRRLIDVSPTGDKIKLGEYRQLVKQINFELGAIAYHCKEEYLDHPNEYDDYIPLSMLGASNDFYNFVLDSWPIFSRDDGTTLKAAWAMYKTYCDDAKVPYPYSQRIFKEELKNYFREFSDRDTEDGARTRNVYRGFRKEKFEAPKPDNTVTVPKLLELRPQRSIFDEIYADCPAQYANESGTPQFKWENVITKLKDLDTSKPHYVKTPINLICIDFDIPDANGEKDFAKNLEEASKWPVTYAEVSKSGKAIHLYYIFNGDVEKLSRVYAPHIEVKVFNGKSSLRRKVTLCNNLPIATISSGLPLKEVKKTITIARVKSEKSLRTLIERSMLPPLINVNGIAVQNPDRINPQGTKPAVDFIFKVLEDAYNSDLSYDVTDMRNAVLGFAAQSTHQADYCIKLVSKMQFKSKDKYVVTGDPHGPDGELIFYDVEVFPNLFLVNWKAAGKDKKVVRMINPTPEDIEKILSFRLVGFNCRRYDNHILYARLMGYTNEQLYNLSKQIISGGRGNTKDGFFGEAYNISYTDVYDFASAGNKKSLKKFEIELGIHHQELGLPWDEPVPEDMWYKVAEYCDNDVIATEAVFNYLSADWTARQILADLAGMTVNDTTNSLTTKIIFEGEKNPQSQFQYRNLAEPSLDISLTVEKFLKEAAPDMMIPYFPGYKFENGVSTYRGETVGEGGYVYSEPGMYGNVALLDIASMHPHSIIAECLFGPEYTKRFKELVDARVHIKHEDWNEVKNMLGGKLGPYVDKVIRGELTSKQLSDALKTAINSVYGLTSASFSNAFRDPRNIDNIVAKRGALFMIDLKHAVQSRGFKVAHIKTDSIKIPDATPEIINFVMEFGKKYGYTFEHEATYDKMCLVNDAVYIARYKDGKHAGEWTATGTQFQVPYVFKTLFSKEPIIFEDMCQTMSVSSALYLDMNEGLGTDEHDYHFVGRVGQFCPIKPGCGGGLLLRDAGNGKYSAATGTKGYRWMESEMVRTMNRQNDIDRGYYDRLVDEAVEDISKYGDFEWFVSEDLYDVPPEGDSHDGV